MRGASVKSRHGPAKAATNLSTRAGRGNRFWGTDRAADPAREQCLRRELALIAKPRPGLFRLLTMSPKEAEYLHPRETRTLPGRRKRRI